MANKKITDLQLISAVTDALSFPCDNGIQSYRATALKLFQYILANGNVTTAMLNDSVVHSLTAVTPALDDYLMIADTSDSNKKKKALVGSLRNAAYNTASNTASAGTADEVYKLSGASFTMTLPTAVGVAGKRYVFLHQGTSLSQVYTMATTSSQTIGGIASGSYKLCTFGETLEVTSDGANWMITARHTQTALASWTPSIAGWSSLNSSDCKWTRNGINATFYINFNATGNSGTTATLSLPSGMSSATTGNLGAGGVQHVAFLGSGFSTASPRQLVIQPSSTVFSFSCQGGSNDSLTRLAGSSISDGSFSAVVTIPITDWQP